MLLSYLPPPLPEEATSTARWSAEAYTNDADSELIPLLTLSFSGEDRYTMSHWFILLGINPN